MLVFNRSRSIYQYSNIDGLRAFSVIAPILWNDLPIDIRSIDDANKFKSKLKTFL